MNINLENKLIKSCTCGNTDNFTNDIINNINILKCNTCKVIHQDLKDFNEEKYYDFYKTTYHIEYQENRGTMTYEERYEHDRKISKLRFDQYKDYIYPPMVGLDIGSSNSAFVHEGNSLGFSCLGLEPGQNIGDDHVTIRGTLSNVYFNDNHFDFITMHDSIEHMINVNIALTKVYNILKPEGMLLVDLPDYFDPAGQHHWKYIEHLWFFDKDQFKLILENAGFKIRDIKIPIPGKLVFYAKK
jgi:SAM-dependent methyltransferase